MALELLPQTQPQPVLLTKCSIKQLFFSPIRFCGRRWMTGMNCERSDRVCQIAIKVLTFPILVCGTILAGGLALIGAVIFSPDRIPSCIEYHPGGDISLLRQDVSNEQVEERIKKQLTAAGLNCKVKVTSLERNYINHNYCPQYIHRYVTLTNSSSTTIRRLWKVIENHFWNKNIPNLENLHSCIYAGTSNKNLDRLKEVLALHAGIQFSIAFDLVYARAEVLYGSNFSKK